MINCFNEIKISIFCLYFRSSFSRAGGDSISKIVRSDFGMLLTNEARVLYNWKGSDRSKNVVTKIGIKIKCHQLGLINSK